LTACDDNDSVASPQSEPDAISEETTPRTPTPTYYAGNQENPVFKILKCRREMTKDEREAQITT